MVLGQRPCRSCAGQSHSMYVGRMCLKYFPSFLRSNRPSGPSREPFRSSSVVSIAHGRAPMGLLQTKIDPTTAKNIMYMCAAAPVFAFGARMVKSYMECVPCPDRETTSRRLSDSRRSTFHACDSNPEPSRGRHRRTAIIRASRSASNRPRLSLLIPGILQASPRAPFSPRVNHVVD